ncbi:MAG TPA: adenylate/guanylate cyclase domain-containing protein [Actinomycetota bacterium]|jgi:class 3 adenylate cyclase|nr:adenylate/guanylate cyclase domain-containing protein [Actinomycetota bacterium]
MRQEVRKIVSVVFSDVAGSTALAEQLDPEALSRAMTRYFQVARQVHRRHGGVVEKFIGDAVMAVFGIPRAHEDDALRAVRAAAELRDSMAALNRELERDLQVTLSVRTGVNTGLVLAGGEDERQPFVAGDTVNVAARLEQAARPGEVLLGEATYRLVAGAVDVEPVASFAPRGKLTPVAAHRVLRVAPAAGGRAGRPDTPLVGRAGELALLDRILDSVIAGQACRLVALLGDPGVGKSRLLGAFGERARQRAVVLTARCPSYGSEAAQVVGQLADQLTATAGTATGPGGALASDPLAVCSGIRSLLEGLARRRPVVVVVDDLHWAEPAVAELVEYLRTFTRGAAVLLVVAARPQFLDGPARWTVDAADATLDLEPLLAGDAAELAARLCEPGALDVDASDRVVGLAEGNPLVLEELLRPGGPPFPSVVDAVVGAELDRLSASERAVLELASMAGPSFTCASVDALAAPQLRPQVGSLLLALARRRLLRVDGRERGEDGFAFRHRVLHEAAYRGVPKWRRAILHARVAERLTKAGAASAATDEVVGQHLGQAYRYLAQLAGDQLPPPVGVASPARPLSGVAAWS